MQQLEDLIGKNQTYTINKSQLLGSGGYGKAFKCYKKDNPDEEYCAKYIQKISKEDTFQKMLEGERKGFEALCKKANQNMVFVYDLIEQENYLIIIMELCNHNLFEEFKTLLNKASWYNSQEQVNVIQQILTGAKCLYDNNLIHRDIKPENILIKIIKTDNKEKKLYKISDFGFCRRLENLSQQQDNLTRVGTLTHCAPEVASWQKFSGKCDIYSYGILFYQIINLGKLPSEGQYIYAFYEKLKNQPFKFEKNIESEHGQLLKALIEQMIVYNQNDRISFEKLFEDFLFKKSLILQDSLFKLPQIEQDNAQQIQERVEKIFRIQEIFYRKYLLCSHVSEYFEKNIQSILNTCDSIAIYLLINQIGLYQISFAQAICYNLWCDIHSSFIEGNSNEILQLLKLFKTYKDKSQIDRNYAEQQQKIQLAYHRQRKVCKTNYKNLIGQFDKQIKIENNNFFCNNPVIKNLLEKKTPIQNLCNQLEQIKAKSVHQEWFENLLDQEKENLNKICQIEQNQFGIQYFNFIDLDEIFKI